MFHKVYSIFLITILISCNNASNADKAAMDKVRTHAALEDGELEYLNIGNGGHMLYSNTCIIALTHNYYIGNGRLEKEGLIFKDEKSKMKVVHAFISDIGSVHDIENMSINNRKKNYQVNYKSYSRPDIRIYHHAYKD